VGKGVGYMMVQGQLSVITPIVMAGMVAIGIVGVVIDAVLRGFENRIRKGWGR
jgi:NitT/TauT family transport system permease protein